VKSTSTKRPSISDKTSKRGLLGVHVSSAGALGNAIDRAEAVQAECLQIFTRAPGMWRARDFRPGEVETFRAKRAALGNPPLLVHDLYLTNLASPPGDLRDKSIATLVEERERCAAIGADGLVCHMGAHLDVGVALGLQRFASALSEVLARTAGNPVRILLENSAGQGTTLGHEVAHIAQVLDQVDRPDALGVCLDTCHLFAAGYDLRDEDAYQALWDEFERRIGLPRLRAFHLNDSKRGLNCRVDRHEHIGRGEIGKAAFQRLLSDVRTAGLPMIIETAETADMHRVNLELLRKLRTLSLKGKSR